MSGLYWSYAYYIDRSGAGLYQSGYDRPYIENAAEFTRHCQGVIGKCREILQFGPAACTTWEPLVTASQPISSAYSAATAALVESTKSKLAARKAADAVKKAIADRGVAAGALADSHTADSAAVAVQSGASDNQISAINALMQATTTEEIAAAKSALSAAQTELIAANAKVLETKASVTAADRALTTADAKVIETGVTKGAADAEALTASNESKAAIVSKRAAVPSSRVGWYGPVSSDFVPGTGYVAISTAEQNAAKTAGFNACWDFAVAEARDAGFVYHGYEPPTAGMVLDNGKYGHLVVKVIMQGSPPEAFFGWDYVGGTPTPFTPDIYANGYPQLALNEWKTGWTLKHPKAYDLAKGVLGFPDDSEGVASLFNTPSGAPYNYPNRNVELTDDVEKAIMDIAKTINTAQLAMLQRAQSYTNHLTGSATNWIRQAHAGNMKELVITPTMIILENVDEAALTVLLAALKVSVWNGANAASSSSNPRVKVVGTFAKAMIAALTMADSKLSVQGIFEEESLDGLLAAQEAWLRNIWLHKAPESFRLSETNSNSPEWEARFASRTSEVRIRGMESNTRTFYSDGTVTYYDAASRVVSRGFYLDFDSKVAEVFGMRDPNLYDRFDGMSAAQQEIYAAYTGAIPRNKGTAVLGAKPGPTVPLGSKYVAPVKDKETGRWFLPAPAPPMDANGNMNPDGIKVGKFLDDIFESAIEYEPVPFVVGQSTENYDESRFEIMIAEDGTINITDRLSTHTQSVVITVDPSGNTTTTFSDAPPAPGH